MCRSARTKLASWLPKRRTRTWIELDGLNTEAKSWPSPDPQKNWFTVTSTLRQRSDITTNIIIANILTAFLYIHFRGWCIAAAWFLWMRALHVLTSQTLLNAFWWRLFAACACRRRSCRHDVWSEGMFRAPCTVLLYIRKWLKNSLKMKRYMVHTGSEMSLRYKVFRIAHVAAIKNIVTVPQTSDACSLSNMMIIGHEQHAEYVRLLSLICHRART